MPFCSQCGLTTKPTDRFCSNCGNPLTDALDQAPLPETPIHSEHAKRQQPLSADVNVTLHKAPPRVVELAEGASRSWTNLSKRYLSQRWFTTWLGAHLIIFLLSLTGAEFFNDASSSSSKKSIWPFAGFTISHTEWQETATGRRYTMRPLYPFTGYQEVTVTEFQGLFYCYDISDFLLYVVLGLSIAHFRQRK